MKLIDLCDTFVNLENQQFVFSEGFAAPHSYRGYYDEVAFEPRDEVTVESVVKSINLAYDDVFEGYKGGEYSYNSDTRTHLAHYGNSHPDSAEHMEILVCDMLKEYNDAEGKPEETKTAEIDSMIEVLKAYKEGKKIQSRAKEGDDLEWVTASKLNFNFGNFEYRIAPDLWVCKYRATPSGLYCNMESANLELTFLEGKLIEAKVL